ncbi:MAG: DNA mismatch repair protein MutT [Candidatus Marinimicrobia bacterium]|nr:DNA mismatch repair protein MutT [Candidatus Neomarinimicrobiota bacterium]
MKVSTLCYINDGFKTLMLHRTKKENDMHKGKWNGLGGKLESGESPEECVKREVFEESGLKISSPILRGIITFPEFDTQNDWLVFIYTTNKFKGKLIESDEGDLDWIPNQKINTLNLWEGDKIFMEWLQKEKFFSAKFIYKKGVLKNYNVIFY